MRQPGPRFAAVDAEAVEPLLKVLGKDARTPFFVLQNEHPDAPRLAVANRGETDLRDPDHRLTERLDDRVEISGRPVPEKRKGDVQVLAPNEPDVPQLVALPALDLPEDVIGHAQGEKEAEPFIAVHASAGSHASSS